MKEILLQGLFIVDNFYGLPILQLGGLSSKQ